MAKRSTVYLISQLHTVDLYIDLSYLHLYTKICIVLSLFVYIKKDWQVRAAGLTTHKVTTAVDHGCMPFFEEVCTSAM